MTAALGDEASRLVRNDGEPRPCENAVFIGPTRVDLLAAGDGAALTSVAQREAQRIREWRRYDWDRYGQ